MEWFLSEGMRSISVASIRMRVGATLTYYPISNVWKIILVETEYRAKGDR